MSTKWWGNGLILKDEIKKLAFKCGAELVGIAPIERFLHEGDKFKLKSLKCDAKSVIVMGFSVNRGALRGVEEGTNWGAVNAGSPVNPMIIPSVTYQFSRLFEQKYGYEAVSLTKIPTSLFKGDVESAAENTVLFFDYAAYAAGLGEIGRGKFFLTAEYGVRQYFAAILTDAEIECDEIRPKSICDGCMDCAKACPYGAIQLNDIVAQNGPENKKISWNRLCIEKCFICTSGAISNQYLDDGDFNILNRGAKAMNTDIEPSRISAACGRACVAHLEKNVQKNKFINQFRMEQSR